MTKFAKRKPHQLSGGQQQRVALARSVATKPETAAARRADGRAGQEAALADAARVGQHHREPGRHLRDGDPRPGRGDDDGASHRDDGRRAHPPGRHAGRNLRAADQPLHRRIHRLGEPVRGQDRGRRQGHSSPSVRPRCEIRSTSATASPASKGRTSRSRCGRRRSRISKEEPAQQAQQGAGHRSRTSPISAATRSTTCACRAASRSWPTSSTRSAGPASASPGTTRSG